MEDICNKFPLLNEQINELLDNQNLAKCKKASRSLCYIISNQRGRRFFWTRLIKSSIKEDIKEFKEDWKIVFKSKAEILKKFTLVVQKFYKFSGRHDTAYE